MSNTTIRASENTANLEKRILDLLCFLLEDQTGQKWVWKHYEAESPDEETA